MVDIYEKLRRHIDSLSIKYPKTRSGAEIKILKELFTPEQAQIALFMTGTMEDLDSIFLRAKSDGFSKEQVSEALEGMRRFPSVLYKKGNGIYKYALVPLVVGMYELQAGNLTPTISKNTDEYFERYGIEMLLANTPQFRIIPIEKSIEKNQKIVSYDEINKLIETTEGPICSVTCVCREKATIKGNPCKKTSRLELCIAFGVLADILIDQKRGNILTKEAAFELIRKNQQEGLVLQASNTEKLDFICSCCACCCGILRMLNSVPRPVDFTGTNYYAKIDPEQCIGCGKCQTTCQMRAIKPIDIEKVDESRKKNPPRMIRLNKCVGCGLCVPICPMKAIEIIPRENIITPPADLEELTQINQQKKKNTWQRINTLAKLVRGKPQSKK